MKLEPKNIRRWRVCRGEFYRFVLLDYTIVIAPLWLVLNNQELLDFVQGNQ